MHSCGSKATTGDIAHDVSFKVIQQPETEDKPLLAQPTAREPHSIRPSENSTIDDSRLASASGEVTARARNGKLKLIQLKSDATSVPINNDATMRGYEGEGPTPTSPFSISSIHSSTTGGSASLERSRNHEASQSSLSVNSRDSNGKDHSKNRRELRAIHHVSAVRPLRYPDKLPATEVFTQRRDTDLSRSTISISSSDSRHSLVGNDLSIPQGYNAIKSRTSRPSQTLDDHHCMKTNHRRSRAEGQVQEARVPLASQLTRHPLDPQSSEASDEISPECQEDLTNAWHLTAENKLRSSRSYEVKDSPTEPRTADQEPRTQPLRDLDKLSASRLPLLSVPQYPPYGNVLRVPSDYARLGLAAPQHPNANKEIAFKRIKDLSQGS